LFYSFFFYQSRPCFEICWVDWISRILLDNLVHWLYCYIKFNNWV
jgi:hypothetical protein